MDKISKLNMFYTLEDAQGILVAMNIEATTSEPTLMATTITTAVPSLTPGVEMPTPSPEVDQIVEVSANL